MNTENSICSRVYLRVFKSAAVERVRKHKARGTIFEWLEKKRIFLQAELLIGRRPHAARLTESNRTRGRMAHASWKLEEANSQRKRKQQTRAPTILDCRKECS